MRPNEREKGSACSPADLLEPIPSMRFTAERMTCSSWTS